MPSTFTSRVFGCVVIKSINSNYNADFTHQPRTLPDGSVYATDKALKYSVRNYLKKAYPDEKIFYFKSVDPNFKPRTLDESYKFNFGDPKKAGKKLNSTAEDKFFLFKYDGVSVSGLLSDKPKSAALKKYFKDLPEDSDLKTLKSSFDKVVGKKSEQQTIAFVQSKITEDDEESYLFIENGNLQKIDGAFTDLETIANELDNMVTGGIDKKIFLSNLLSCLDIRLFGGTYAGQVNLSIHGPVQITHGIDQYRKGQIYSEQIMSPFRNPGEKNVDSTMTTLGSQSKLSEGHYVHGFSINPHNISDHVTLSEGTALQDEDVLKVKAGLSRGVTFYDSAAKSGSENELLLWVQLKEGSMLVLPSFVELVKVQNDRTIDLSSVSEILARPHIAKHVEKVEINYDQTATKVAGIPASAIVSDINQ
jgi:CRISPR/Cas system type I-B associated protein Csh2 (Cas7 group RAMP superfamily)